MILDAAGRTDIGLKKKDNEDKFAIFSEGSPDVRLFQRGALLVVADGLGGHMGGEIASKLAVSMMSDMLKQEPPAEDPNASDGGLFPVIREAARKANASIFKTNQDFQTGDRPMGTTLVAALLLPGKVLVCNVGDSRCYVLRGGKIIERTIDHSWVEEQIQLGLMTRAESLVDKRRNLVTRSVGTKPEVGVDTYTWILHEGDYIFLCSDGVIDMVQDKQICEVFKACNSSEDISNRIVDVANENGGKDNITAVVARVIEM
ncbi:MAG: protein phosphatase 2C domain-containing protein [Candidatus Hydrogenedentota bacterium]